MSQVLCRVEGSQASRGVVLMISPVAAETLLPAEAAVLLVLGVRPAKALPPGERRGPWRQRAGQGVSQQDITGGWAGVFTRQNIKHGHLHFGLLGHRGAFLASSHGRLGAELVVHGDLLATLGRVGKHSLTGGRCRGHTGGHRPLTGHWGLTAAGPQFPGDGRGGGEAALLGQRQVARLVDRARLLDVVIDCWQLGAHLARPGLPLAAGDGAVDETSLG